MRISCVNTWWEEYKKNTRHVDQYYVAQCIEKTKDSNKRVRESESSKADIQDKLD